MVHFGSRVPTICPAHHQIRPERLGSGDGSCLPSNQNSAGGIVGVIGPSGAGEMTLISLIAGEEQWTARVGSATGC